MKDIKDDYLPLEPNDPLARKPVMKDNLKKYLILGVLVIAVCAVIAAKNLQTHQQAAGLADDSVVGQGKPVLLELGSHSCIPCKKMMPILDELAAEQEAFVVSFVDVWAVDGKSEQYGIQSIPTQIFFDADGKELFRHVGFYPQEDILSKWKELGVEVSLVAMIDELFVSLSHMIEQNAWLAMAAALGWGVLSILLSPCHLASIPLVVAYVNQGQTLQTKRAFWLSCLFSLGIFLSILCIGLITASFGRMLGDIGPWGSWLVASVFMLFGLILLDVISLPWSGPNMTNSTKTGAWGALVLGLIFGAAVGPCTFAYMAPVLAVVFDRAASGFAYSTLLILLYSIGHCSIIILAGTLGGRLQRFLNWDQKSHVTIRLRKACGIILIMVGFYLLWKA